MVRTIKKINHSLIQALSFIKKQTFSILIQKELKEVFKNKRGRLPSSHFNFNT